MSKEKRIANRKIRKDKRKEFWSDFKKFVTKGNVVDLAVAVVVGAAFNAIVSSLVSDIINPCIGYLTGNVNLEDLKFVLVVANEAEGVAEVAITYGMFIKRIFDFLIIAFSIFIGVRVFKKVQARAAKSIERSRKRIEKLIKKGKITEAQELAVAIDAPVGSPKPPAPTPTEILLTEIRDLLKNSTTKIEE